MPDRTTPQKFTAPVRRGFGTLLTYLQEDIDVGLFDPKHPLHRRLKAPAMHNAMAALRYMEQTFADQQKWDTAKASTRSQQEGEKEGPGLAPGPVPHSDPAGRSTSSSG